VITSSRLYVGGNDRPLSAELRLPPGRSDRQRIRFAHLLASTSFIDSPAAFRGTISCAGFMSSASATDCLRLLLPRLPSVRKAILQ